MIGEVKLDFMTDAHIYLSLQSYRYHRC